MREDVESPIGAFGACSCDPPPPAHCDTGREWLCNIPGEGAMPPTGSAYFATEPQWESTKEHVEKPEDGELTTELPYVLQFGQSRP